MVKYNYLQKRNIKNVNKKSTLINIIHKLILQKLPKKGMVFYEKEN